MIYQKKTVHAATFRHSIGSSSPQYSPSCLEARHFHLWRVHSIGHFHNSSRCCLKENQLHHLDAPFPNMLFLLQTPSHSMDLQRWPSTQVNSIARNHHKKVWFNLPFDQKDISIFLHQHFNLCYIFSKNSWQATCYCEFYLCYSPQKTVLTFSSLQVAVRSRHARTVQTSDYSAVALKVLLLSDKRKNLLHKFFIRPAE